MPLARRLLAAVLAVLPAGWGLCVTWVASTAESRMADAPCRCCSSEPPSEEPTDAPSDCPGCGFKDAGRGVVRAETVPDLPDAEVAAAASARVPVALPESRPAERVESHPSGPPLRDRLSSVVLLN